MLHNFLGMFHDVMVCKKPGWALLYRHSFRLSDTTLFTLVIAVLGNIVHPEHELWLSSQRLVLPTSTTHLSDLYYGYPSTRRTMTTWLLHSRRLSLSISSWS